LKLKAAAHRSRSARLTAALVPRAPPTGASPSISAGMLARGPHQAGSGAAVEVLSLRPLKALASVPMLPICFRSPRNLIALRQQLIDQDGGPERIRTFDLCLRRKGDRRPEADRSRSAEGCATAHLNLIGIVPIFAVRAAHGQPPLDRDRRGFHENSKRDDVRHSNPGCCRTIALDAIKPTTAIHGPLESTDRS